MSVIEDDLVHPVGIGGNDFVNERQELVAAPALFARPPLAERDERTVALILG